MRISYHTRTVYVATMRVCVVYVFLYRIVENFGEFVAEFSKFNPPKVYCNIPVVSQITHVITKSLLVFWSTVSLWNLPVHSRFCLCRSQMGSLSKKVPYLRDNFLLSACQFTASSQSNGIFTELVRLHGADSVSQKPPKFYLLTHYFPYSPKFFRQFVF